MNTLSHPALSPEEIAEDELNREPSVDLPNLEQPRQHGRLQKVSEASQIVSIYASLTIFSILGALGRIGLELLTTYDGQSVFTAAASQAVGCAVMGMVVRQRKALEDLDVALFLGLGTGFCGSMTTFSTWMYQVFGAFANLDHHSHNGVKNVVDAFTQIYITLAVATAGIRLGVHTSTLLVTVKTRAFSSGSEGLKASNPGAMSPVTRMTSSALFVLTAIIFWLIPILLSAFKPTWRHITLALVFAPLGTFLRYQLSSRLNSKNPTFPCGTFAANMLATILISVCGLLQYSSAHRSFTSCSVLQGMMDGFCGCLSTVSTLATEIRGLRRRHAYRYGIASIVCGQALVILIFGSYWWSQGLHPMCSFYA